ncbi:hydrolase [Frateuria sp. Soil773]|uniref:C40 family peptidase n=1 Tax=Frateuria sp. Soil773 TaxID=1736407 RepID=UPI0006FFA8D3|nr:C40 family peptidase [Frateuria sp. Soil773]KRE88852.1 hydrolase [Frateuria sp. Soil773]
MVVAPVIAVPAKAVYPLLASPAVAASPLLAQPGVAAKAGPVGRYVAVPSFAAGRGPVQERAAVPAAGSDAEDAADQGDLRKTLIAMAMKLRDIRYVRGGRDPSTGFDCSGFVRYVFAHAIGLQLPTNSASQFLAGLKVKRGDMQPGDLVFFRTGGRKRISHVGIYIDNGRFIHSPSRGKSVEVSSLDEAYWSKRFAGARRPEGIAQNG